MYFNKKENFIYFLDSLTEIGFGSQGVCYLDKNKVTVYKVCHQFFDEGDEDYFDYYVEYKESDVLKFSNIINKTFIFPTDVIMVDNIVVGYVSRYVNGKSLYKINPLNISLDRFINSISNVKSDIEIISSNGILTRDVMYNILYGRNGFNIIDSDDYCQSEDEFSKINRVNHDNFNHEIFYFLVDGYFDEFIKSDLLLNEMYKQSGIDIIMFIDEFRNRLSEVSDCDIKRLGDAKKCLNKKRIRNINYERLLQFSQRHAKVSK